MKAIVYTEYGPPEVLQLKEIEKPTPKDNEVLIKVHAASVHPDVWHVVSGRPYALRLMGAGLLKPKNSIPGTDVAGHVESVGKNVAQFQPGDEVCKWQGEIPVPRKVVSPVQGKVKIPVPRKVVLPVMWKAKIPVMRKVKIPFLLADSKT